MLVYVCQMFPWVTQAFTVREVRLLREEGLDLEVASFRRPADALMDAGARELAAATTFLPSPATLEAWLPLLRALGRRPLRSVRLLLEAVLSRGLVRTTARLRARGVLAVARGAWLAERFSDARLFHAEFADEAAGAAMAAAALAGVRFSFKSHSSFNPQQLGRKARRAAFVAVENAFDRDHYFAELPDERVLVNRGGVLLDGPPPDPPRVESGELRILSVGTLQEKKGHRHLVAALRLLRERSVGFRCLVVGSGPLERELREAIDASGLSELVTLEPYRPHAELLRLYAEHDVFALPCVVTPDGDRDGIPNVLVEAAAAGCALVSTPVSGIPELVEDAASGLLVPERDEQALAHALERLAEDPELRRTLVAGADAILRERFDLRQNVTELAERFRSELD